MNENNFHKKPTRPIFGKIEEPPLPEKIGPYKIEALLDKGGMSLLYLATHPETKEPMTVKVLLSKYISNPEVVQRFLNESEIIAMTNHPNIIKMRGHGEWEGGLYIAMEYVEGISLRKFILQKPLSLKKALKMIVDIAYAICHLHTHGVIHRDLKPENVLVTDDGDIKIIDFGIAQVLEEKTTPFESPKQKLIGTPIYISPEQKENPDTVSFPSDIYSLGIIAYELILGKLCHGHIHLALMPKGMQPILKKCLQKKSVDRYRDLVDFISDVTAYLNSPVIEKDRILGDKLTELSEEFSLVQRDFTPIFAPTWRGIEIGIASFQDVNIPGCYFDFFTLPDNNFAVFLSEAFGKGVASFSSMATFRGMVKALYQFAKSPEEMTLMLNDLLLKESLGQVDYLNYLFLKPQENQVIYTSLGSGSLWYFSKDKGTTVKCLSDGFSLGANYDNVPIERKISWAVGDFIILTNLVPNQEAEKELMQISKELSASGAQEIADEIQRKFKIAFKDALKGRFVTFIVIKRS